MGTVTARTFRLGSRYPGVTIARWTLALFCRPRRVARWECGCVPSMRRYCNWCERAPASNPPMTSVPPTARESREAFYAA